MRDLVVMAVLLGAFAAVATVHVTMCFGLLGKPPRWRAWVALLVVPLAPIWAWREGMKKRVLLWTVLGCVYLTALALASV